MELREATDTDCRSVWEIATAPGVRRFSFSRDPIPYASHVEWYRSVLANEDRRLYVGVEGGKVVGYVRFDRDREVSTVSIAIDPSQHGRRLGRRLLEAATEVYPHRPIQAEVHPGNERSVDLFSGWGAVVGGSDGSLVFRLG